MSLEYKVTHNRVTLQIVNVTGLYHEVYISMKNYETIIQLTRSPTTAFE